jgi:hypothetical protein
LEELKNCNRCKLDIKGENGELLVWVKLS